MMQFNIDERAGQNDVYFAKKIAVLAESGLIEFEGDLNQMERCEVRLQPKANDF